MDQIKPGTLVVCLDEIEIPEQLTRGLYYCVKSVYQGFQFDEIELEGIEGKFNPTLFKAILPSGSYKITVFRLVRVNGYFFPDSIRSKL